VFAANGKVNSVFRYFPLRGLCGGDFGLIKRSSALNRAYPSEERRKLIAQSSMAGKLSVTAQQPRQSINWDDQNVTKVNWQFGPSVKLFLEPSKSFSASANRFFACLNMAEVVFILEIVRCCSCI
jgi:hypothetical protein